MGTAHETADDGYLRSYVVILIAAGVIGLLLPVALVLIDAVFLDRSFHARDSISSYYHSPARDVFVGSLVVIGILLVTYRWGRFDRTFWASTIGGAGLLVVAGFPTERPGIPTSGPHCGDPNVPIPPGCTALEQKWGEVTVGNIHLTAAGIALTSLAVIAFLFAREEGKDRLARIHVVCGLLIVAGLAIALLGWVHPFRFLSLTPLYIGEVVTVLSFGAGWLARGIHLKRTPTG
jgi:Protein of unknown function (DUF998)